MTQWAHVSNGAVDQTAASLPPVWGPVTGFDLADAATAAANGWLPLVGEAPAVPPGKVLVGPSYSVASDQVEASWALRDATAAEAEAALAFALNLTTSAIGAEFKRRVAAGWPYTPAGATAPLIIDIDADGRANLSGMALSALLAVQGVAPWELGRGWVARGGTRIPFDTPQPAIPFALGTAGFYSNLVQHEQDLCDEVKALTDPTAVIAFDVTAGWPGDVR